MTLTNNDLLKLAMANEKELRNWTRFRPVHLDRSYDTLIRDINANKIGINVVPDDNWEEFLQENKMNRGGRGVGGFYEQNDDVINLPQRNIRNSTVPHELLHYFSGHSREHLGVPKINPYIEADMKLKGWLPSLHPAGRRPTLSGNNPLSNWWNKKMATGQTEYSDENKYHPWYDEHAYDTTANKMLENWQGSESPVRYDNNQYPVYQKQSDKAAAFRQAFKKARGKDLDVFEWDGRKYTTELA